MKGVAWNRKAERGGGGRGGRRERGERGREEREGRGRGRGLHMSTKSSLKW